MNKNYEIKIFHDFDEVTQSTNSNIDIWVEFSDGTKFTATFFTLINIQHLMTLHKESGECCWGLYFYASNMIIVPELSMNIIDKTIEDLIETGEFTQVFLQVE